MASVNVNLDGLKGVEQTLQEYPQEVERQVRFQIEATARSVQDSARRKVPVDTSNLQSSIQVDLDRLDDLYAEVKTALEYARLIEYGYKGTQQVQAHRRTITQAFGEELDSPRAVDVQAHDREVDREGAYYMTRAVAAHKQTWRKKIQAAIKQASKNASSS